MADLGLDYTSRDYAGIKASMLAFRTKIFPEWTSTSESDLGLTLLDLWAYGHDIQSYYADRVQQESYLSTATQRISVINIATMLGYIPHGPIPSSGTVRLVTPSGSPAVVVPAGTQIITDHIDAIDGPLFFETDVAVTAPADGDPEDPAHYVIVNVTNGQTVNNQRLGSSSGNPEQEYRLPHNSVIDGTVRVFVTGTTGPEEWTYADYLIDADPEDKVFTTFGDADGSVWVRFGDGINGQIPQAGLDISATYRIGGGAISNLNAGLVTTVAEDISGVEVARSAAGLPYSSAMVGGADAESTESIRRNAPFAYRTQDRAVTPQDFVDLALKVPGVTKASAVANHYTSVTLYVAGPGGQPPSDRLKGEVYDFFSRRTLAGVTLTVTGPALIYINFGSSGTPCTLQVLPNFSQNGVLEDVQRAFQRIVSLDSVDFGGHLALSQVYDIVQSVRGVDYVVIPIFARYDQAQVLNTWLQFRPSELPSMGTVWINAFGGS